MIWCLVVWFYDCEAPAVKPVVAVLGCWVFGDMDY